MVAAKTTTQRKLSPSRYSNSQKKKKKKKDVKESFVRFPSLPTQCALSAIKTALDIPAVASPVDEQLLRHNTQHKHNQSARKNNKQ